MSEVRHIHNRETLSDTELVDRYHLAESTAMQAMQEMREIAAVLNGRYPHAEEPFDPFPPDAA